MFMGVFIYSLRVSLCWKFKCNVQKETKDIRSESEAKHPRAIKKQNQMHSLHLKLKNFMINSN